MPSFLRYDWAGGPRLVFAPNGYAPTVNLPGSPFAAGQTIQVQGQFTDAFGNGIQATQFQSCTLTIVDTLTGAVVNNCLQASILNTGRGSIDSQGNLTLTLGPDDTSLAGEPGATQCQRSCVIDWMYSQGAVTSYGREQANLILLALAGP